MNKFKTKEIIELEEKLRNQEKKLIEKKEYLKKNIEAFILSSQSSKKNIVSFKNINKLISEFSTQSDYVKEKPDYSKSLKEYETVFDRNSNTLEKFTDKIEKIIIHAENLKKDIKEALSTIQDFFKYKEEQIDILLQKLNNAYNSNLFEECKTDYQDKISKLNINLEYFLKTVENQISEIMKKSMNQFKEDFHSIFNEWNNIPVKNQSVDDDKNIILV